MKLDLQNSIFLFLCLLSFFFFCSSPSSSPDLNHEASNHLSSSPFHLRHGLKEHWRRLKRNLPRRITADTRRATPQS
ncbi:hypothetical protein RchiOBHm_Chr2g0087951 [Rosa chinensis]|uniref:Uncharacterized protein n=1 Tax=Rosa chinensis TaxID=74649 RepID=A0A2P6RIT6_ROSCH|nr:hypothetical protein RchiOBHm_Chr2g0087951 [Rosa chinensis]